MSTGAGENLGEFRVDEYGPDWVAGKLQPAAGYEAHRFLFAEWTQAVDDMAFSCLDPIESRIEALQLSASAQQKVLSPAEIQIHDGERDVTVVLRFKTPVTKD